MGNVLIENSQTLWDWDEVLITNQNETKKPIKLFPHFQPLHYYS